MDNDIKVMISLIEEEYPRVDRNTPLKMRILIKKEFDVDVTESTISSVTGIEEDFEYLNRKIEYYGRI